MPRHLCKSGEDVGASVSASILADRNDRYSGRIEGNDYKKVEFFSSEFDCWIDLGRLGPRTVCHQCGRNSAARPITSMEIAGAGQ